MKTKENVVLALTALLCTLLFYRESWGLNIPLFAILISTAQLFYKPQLRKNRHWLLVAVATFVSAIAYYFTNNTSAVILFILSVLFSSGIQVKNSLLFFLPAHAFLNFFVAPFALSKDILEKAISEKRTVYPIRMFIIPALLFVVFLFIYAQANDTLLDQIYAILKNINLSFIFSLILSFFIILPLIRGRIIGWMAFIENACEKIVGFVSEASPSENSQKLSRLMKEAMMVFVSLILLLIYFISLDGMSLFKTDQTTSLSSNLHSSIYILIFSMIMAIGVILYYFSLPIVYHPQFKKIKIAVNVWIVLNLLLCIICLIKNNLYVEHFGLTYKRIGVYTYLITTACALLITSYKTMVSLPNWQFIKVNSWMSFGVLILFSCIPWDIVITRNNLNHTTNPDIQYIQALSKSARLEYYQIALMKNNISYSEVEKIKQDILMDNYSVNRLKSHNYLSLTAEDLRIISGYDKLKEALYIPNK